MNHLDLFPWPQWLDRQKGTWPVTNGTATVWMSDTARAVAEGVSRLAGVWQVTLSAAPSPERADVMVGGLNEPLVAARLARHPRLVAEPLSSEGYVMAVDAAGVTVGGADSRGCLYGLGSLAQLLHRGQARGGIPYLEVRDWPHKPMRGVHFYMPGRENLPFFKEVLAWLSSLRYNTLFLEVGGAMRYERHPEINEGWAHLVRELRSLPGGPPGLNRFVPFPKDSPHTETGRGGWLEQSEVADLVAYASSCGIETIPELQSLSHAYYLLAAHPELAERAWDPWPDTYCPSDPRTYELYFDVLEEAIEVFRPRMIHIGHDEAYTFGVCDRCRGKSGAELLAGDINKIHGFLAGKDIRTVLWADKLENIIVGGVDHGGRARRSVNASRQTDFTMRETHQAVDFVPKDILTMDWYWGLDPHSERYLQGKGFEVIFGNFGDNYRPQAFQNWDTRAAGDDIVGAEVSTWCDVSEYALGHNLSLFNFLFSSNMLWWRHYSDRERDGTLSAVARLQPLARQVLSGSAVPSLQRREAKPLALAGALNVISEVIEGADGTWSGVTPTPFELSPRVVQVSEQSPESRPIVVGSKAAAVVFLHHCCTGRMPRATWTIPDPLGKDETSLLGYYLVAYHDGGTEKVGLRYGDNIAQAEGSFGDGVPTSPFWAQPAWVGRDRQGRRITLWAHEWINPYPEKAIADLRLHIDNPAVGESLSLIAVTLIL